MRSSGVDIGINNIPVFLLRHADRHLGSWTDITMNLKDVCFAPTHPRKLRLLEPLHVTLGTHNVRSQDDEQFGALHLFKIITEQVFDNWQIP